MTIAAMEREGPGLSASLNCRKRYIADKITAALDDVDAVVVLGAGFETLAYRQARMTPIPIFEVDQPVNVARKTAAVKRALGAQPNSVRLMPLGFEHDDVLTVLTEHGYRPESRAVFVWDAVTQYIEPSGRHRTTSPIERTAYAEKT